jgi:hypothetical protein
MCEHSRGSCSMMSRARSLGQREGVKKIACVYYKLCEHPDAVHVTYVKLQSG